MYTTIGVSSLPPNNELRVGYVTPIYLVIISSKDGKRNTFSDVFHVDITTGFVKVTYGQMKQTGFNFSGFDVKVSSDHDILYIEVGCIEAKFTIA